MKQKIVVTNLRIDEGDLARARVIAAEEKMSFNEYVTGLIKSANRNNQIVRSVIRKANKEDTLWQLMETAKQPNKPLGELSEDDQIIYGLK